MSTNRFKFYSLSQLEQNFDSLVKKELIDKKIVLVDQEKLLDKQKRKKKAVTFSELTPDEQLEVSLSQEEFEKFSFVNNQLNTISYEGLNPERLKQFLAVKHLFAVDMESANEWGIYLDIKFNAATAAINKAILITAAMQYYLHTQIGTAEYKYRDPNKSLVYRESVAAIGISETNQMDQETQKELDALIKNIIPVIFDNSNPTPTFWNAYNPSSLLASIEKASVAGDKKLVSTVKNDKFAPRKDTTEKDKIAADAKAYKPELTAEGKKENADFLRREKEEQEAHAWLHAKENQRRAQNEIDLRTKAIGDLQRYQRTKLGTQSPARKSLNASINRLEDNAIKGLSDVDVHAYNHDIKQTPTEMNKPEDYAANKVKFNSEFTASCASFATFFSDRKANLEKSFFRNNPKFLQQDDARSKTLEQLKEEGVKRAFKK